MTVTFTGAVVAKGIVALAVCRGCTVLGDGPHACLRMVAGVQAAPVPCACQVYETCASHRRPWVTS
jgi:hypothetical protein